jgi:molybdopterin-binding protein
MKVSARNLLKGSVVKIEKGAVNSVVYLKTDRGEEIVSVITNHSVDRLGLTPGKPAYAMVKASSVMVVVDD